MTRLVQIASVLLALVPAQAVPETRSGGVGDAAAAASGVALQELVDLSPTVERRRTVIRQSPDGLFYLRARVNGVPIQFVVDSGASVIVLSAADARRAGVSSAENVAVDTAGGSAAMHRARIERVAFAGQTLTGIDAAIVKRDLAVSLLGQSALSQLNSVTFRGGQLELE